MLLQPPDASLAGKTFESYIPHTPLQTAARTGMEAFGQVLMERAAERQGGLSRLARAFGLGARPVGPQGVYLVGPVGVGKTHLLGALYHALPATVRSGFVAYGELSKRLYGHDPARVVAELARRCDVLFVDELEVKDPANAVIVVRFLTALFESGLALVATSNRRPEDLYTTGFRAKAFGEFVDGYRDRFLVLPVDGEDARRNRSDNRRGTVWVGVPTATAPCLIAAAAASRATNPLIVPFADALRQMAERPDGLDQLVAHDALFLSDVQIATADDAQRFIWLLDRLDRKPAPLYLTMTVEPEALWTDGDHAFEFRRAVSRLRGLCRVVTVGSAISCSV